MPPKRTRQASASAESQAKRVHIETAAAGPLSPVTDMSDDESAEVEVVAAAGVSGTTEAIQAEGTVLSSSGAEPVLAVYTNNVLGTSAGGTVQSPTQRPEFTVNEPTAVAILHQLGVEPGALVGADGNTLGSILTTVLEGGNDVHAQPHAVLAPAVVQSAVTASSPTPTSVPAGTLTSSSSRGGAHLSDDAVKASAMQALVNKGVSMDRVSHWSAAELKRLDIVLGWADPANNIYNITSSPSKKDWGIAAPFDDTSNILCLDGTGTPITLWIPGELSAQYWFDNEGYPAQRAAFAVQPMVDSCPDYCQRQLHELSMPTGSSKVADQMGPGQVKASRWMNERGKKGQPSKTFEFKAVYDARTSLRAKYLLQQLSVGQLQLHDIVVMEVRVQRYPIKDSAPAEASKGKRRTMEKWQAYYDLQAVYKFKDAANVVAAQSKVADFEI
ncbi:hypothetical protein B0H15DRAFT_957686 [Mycena belliarum]|uniref:Uncharacterized protein n=1 Tax=Mycena belliarum TaxID=1033014 RepID=A0AAD6XLB6_9AGAR|nr:hypothetical protein B0H15DRAFT_957686 [Mycena belliae]